MATLKLKKPATKTVGRPPLRGRGVSPRPTRAQAEAARARRDAAPHGGERRPAHGDRPRHEGGPPLERRGGSTFGPRRDAPGGDRPAPWRDGGGAGPRRDAGHRDARGGPPPGDRRDERAGPHRHDERRAPPSAGDRDRHAGPRPGGDRHRHAAPRPGGSPDGRGGPRDDAGHGHRTDDRRPPGGVGPRGWPDERRGADPRRSDERRGPPDADRQGHGARGGAGPQRGDERAAHDAARPPRRDDDRHAGAGPVARHDDRRGRPADDRGGPRHDDRFATHGAGQRPGSGGRDARRHRDDRSAGFGPPPRDDRRGPGPAGAPRGGPHDRRAAPGDDRPPRRGDSPGHGPARRHDEAPRGGDARRGGDSRAGGDVRHGDASPGPRRADDRRSPHPGERRAAPAGVRPQPGWPRRDDRPRPPGPPPRQGRDRNEDSDDFEPLPHAEGSLRLSKRMVQLGLASRREADEWIEKGWVRVDGKAVSKLGARVLPEQRITLDPRASSDQAQRVTILLNKPAGHVSGQAEDGNEPAIALVKAQTQWEGDASGQRFAHVHLRGIAPAGRLDLESTGLLVFTQDGRIAKQLIGEDSEIEKEYVVHVEPARADADAPPADAASLPSDADLALLRHGLELDGEPLKPAEVDRLDGGRLRFVLKQGRKRQIRRMCEAVGLKVTALERVRIGGVQLGDLPPGQWRYLRDDEAFG